MGPLRPGERPRGPRQLLQDRGGGLWGAGPRLQHLQGGGRLAGLWLWRFRAGGPAAFSVPHAPCQGGCITKLETFIQEHLRVIGAVGIGIACVQVRAGSGAGWAGAWGATGWLEPVACLPGLPCRFLA